MPRLAWLISILAPGIHHLLSDDSPRSATRSFGDMRDTLAAATSVVSRDFDDAVQREKLLARLCDSEGRLATTISIDSFLKFLQENFLNLSPDAREVISCLC